MQILPEHRIALWKFEDVNKRTGNQYVKYYYHTLNSLLPLHSHDFYEINIIVSGSGKHFIRSRELLTAKGDIFVIPPNVKHGYACSERMIVYHILLSNRFISEFGGLLDKLPGYRFLFHIEPMLRSSLDTHFYLKSDSISTESVTNDMGLLEANENAEEEAICHILSLIAKLSGRMHRLHAFNDRDVPESKVLSVIESIEYIETNCTQKLNYHTLADKCAMSYSTYWRLYKKLTGTTPVEYQISCRIKMAEALLRSSDDSVLSIALTCGFYDSSHFIREFLKRKKMTPAQFRKNPV